MGRTSDAKERLLTVAQQLFWQQNFSTVSVDTICKEAGVNKGSFYYYFNSKIDIVVEAIGAIWETMDKDIFAVCFDRQYSSLERVERFINCAVEGLEKQKRETGFVLGCPFTNIAGETWARDEAILLKIREVIEGEKTHYCHLIRDGGGSQLSEAQVEQMAEEMIAVMAGFVLQAKVMNEPALARRALPFLRGTIISLSQNKAPAIA